jgi:hypothetical protein
VPLSIEPTIEIPAPEAPLSADPDGGQLANPDQSVDRPGRDLQIAQDLFSGQKAE